MTHTHGAYGLYVLSIYVHMLHAYAYCFYVHNIVHDYILIVHMFNVYYSTYIYICMMPELRKRI